MLNQEQIAMLEYASEQNPVFLKFDMSDPINTAAPVHTKDITVAVVGWESFGDTYSPACCVLDPGERVSDDTHYRVFQMGDKIYPGATGMTGSILSHQPDLMAKYDEFLEMHAKAPFVFQGWLYEELPPQRATMLVQFNRETLRVETISGEELPHGGKVHNLEEAKFLAAVKYPTYYMGSQVGQMNIPSGDFAIIPYPSNFYYSPNEWHTFYDRVHTVIDRFIKPQIEAWKKAAEAQGQDTSRFNVYDNMFDMGYVEKHVKEAEGNMLSSQQAGEYYEHLSHTVEHDEKNASYEAVL